MTTTHFEWQGWCWWQTRRYRPTHSASPPWLRASIASSYWIASASAFSLSLWLSVTLRDSLWPFLSLLSFVFSLYLSISSPSLFSLSLYDHPGFAKEAYLLFVFFIFLLLPFFFSDFSGGFFRKGTSSLFGTIWYRFNYPELPRRVLGSSILFESNLGGFPNKSRW